MKTVLDPLGGFSVEQPAQVKRSCWNEEAWFCLRTHPKQEHIAAAQLRHDAGLEIFLPRIRYIRSTRTRSTWVTEPLFCNYLFARFDLVFDLKRVQHARGVRGVVHFGDHWPVIPDEVIEELRRLIGDQDVHVIEETLRPGDPVQLVGGAMDGLRAVVTRVMPAKQRVAVLLDLLGRQTPLELDRGQLVSCHDERSAAGLSVWQSPVIGISQ